MNRNINSIPFFMADIGEEEKRAVIEVLDSGWLTTGKQCAAFEEEFARFCGSKYALTVQSGTSGLHLALSALGIAKGDKVAVPDYTFAATAEVAVYQGAVPVFIDSLKDSPQMDPVDLKEKISKNPEIKAVIAVHYSGAPCHINEIAEICRKNNIYLVEDCAHSFPVKIKEGFLGTIGDIGVFSFYATKCITTGEGGMVLTANTEFHNTMKKLRLHGIDRDVWNRYTQKAKASSWRYDITSAGYKYNMTDFQAAMGRVQLKRAWELLEKREKAVRLYQEKLSNLPDIIIPPLYDKESSFHLFIIAVKGSTDLRDSLIEFLFDRGIGVSVHFIPLHRMTYYKKETGLEDRNLENASRWGDSVISLPLFTKLTDEMITYICNTIGDFFRIQSENSGGE